MNNVVKELGNSTPELIEEVRKLNKELRLHRHFSGPALTTKQAVQYLNISERTFEKLIAGGKIRPVRIGRRVRRFLREHLDHYLAECLR